MKAIKTGSKALTDVRQWREEVAAELANETLDARNHRAREFAKRLGLRVLESSDLARPSLDANRPSG